MFARGSHQFLKKNKRTLKVQPQLSPSIGMNETEKRETNVRHIMDVRVKLAA